MVDIHDPNLMELKDTDKYVRQIGSKALLPSSNQEALEYEQKRKLILDQRKRLDAVEEKLGSLEQKFDRMLSLLEKMNADAN
jgi:hypothetical protein